MNQFPDQRIFVISTFFRKIAELLATFKSLASINDSGGHKLNTWVRQFFMNLLMGAPRFIIEAHSKKISRRFLMDIYMDNRVLHMNWECTIFGVTGGWRG
jgi:hypothetical protein